ncbi:MAG: PH domain-containing protein [Phormidesmis sp.]
MFFRSAIDAWFYLGVVSFPLLTVRVAMSVLAEANSTVLSLVVSVIAPLIVLPAWLLFNTYYRIDATVLHVYSGPFTWAVPIDQIHMVAATRSFSFSPALSQNRLKITYGRNQSLSVSPRYKAAFLETLGFKPASVLQPQKSRPNPFALGETCQ